MGFELGNFGNEGLESSYLDWLVDEQAVDIQRHFGKLWEYYANRTEEVFSSGTYERKINESGRCYVQAQEYGLPSRITGLSHSGKSGVFGGQAVGEVQRKEVVIENDIAWRISAAVDFLFGKPISIVSKSPDERKAAEIEGILKAVFSSNGAIGFFQDMAVLGGVYGFVDCLVRPSESIIQQITSTTPFTLSIERVRQLAKTIGLELIEAPRALPILDENDYKKIKYYVQHFYQKKNSVAETGSFLWRLMGGGSDKRKAAAVTEIISDRYWQRYEDKELVAEGKIDWGFLPVVHIQNMAMPFYYEGTSDVESLIPMQDELNTRLTCPIFLYQLS